MMGRSKNIVGIFIGVVMVACLLIFNTGCEQFGSVPKGSRLELIFQSKNYNKVRRGFKKVFTQIMGNGRIIWL